jgi:predicted exporter
VAYGVVAVVIINFFRQLDSMLIVLIPLCSSLAVIFILTCMGISISLFHILGLFLLLGLGLDYTIFIYNEARELSDGVMPISMKAVWLSALTSSLSFGLLSASSTPMIQQFGLTMLLGSLLNLLFSPLVVLLRRKRSDAVSESL